MPKNDFSFVKWNVPDIELEIAADELPHPDDWYHVAKDWLKRGYKVSMSYNPETDSYVVSLTGKFTLTEDDGKVISVFTGTLERGYQKLAYLVDVVSDRGGFVKGDRISKELHDKHLRMLRDQLGLKQS